MSDPGSPLGNRGSGSGPGRRVTRIRDPGELNRRRGLGFNVCVAPLLAFRWLSPNLRTTVIERDSGVGRRVKGSGFREEYGGRGVGIPEFEIDEGKRRREKCYGYKR
jgi:hypothetical protein